MPFVKELCKCIKRSGSTGGVHGEERFLPQCYREKIALGSCGSCTCEGRAIKLKQLSWLASISFGYLSNSPV